MAGKPLISRIVDKFAMFGLPAHDGFDPKIRSDDVSNRQKKSETNTKRKPANAGKVSKGRTMHSRYKK